MLTLPTPSTEPRLVDANPKKGYRERLVWRVWITTATRAGHVDVRP